MLNRIGKGNVFVVCVSAFRNADIFCSRYIFKTPKSSGFKQYFSVHFMFVDLMMV